MFSQLFRQFLTRIEFEIHNNPRINLAMIQQRTIDKDNIDISYDFINVTIRYRVGRSVFKVNDPSLVRPIN